MQSCLRDCTYTQVGLGALNLKALQRLGGFAFGGVWRLLRIDVSAVIESRHFKKERQQLARAVAAASKSYSLRELSLQHMCATRESG